MPDKYHLPLEARLAIEWLNASGDRTPYRLDNLVEHFCETNAIDLKTRGTIKYLARRHMGFEA